MCAESVNPVASRFLEALGSRDNRELAEVASSDLVWWWPSTLPYGGFTKGLEAVIEEVQKPAAALFLPDTLGVTTIGALDGDGFALVEWRLEGSAVNGNAYLNYYALLLFLAEDKVTSVHEYCDTQRTGESLWGNRAKRDPETTTYSRPLRYPDDSSRGSLGSTSGAPFMAALSAGDFEALAAASTADLSWWWPSTLPYGGLTSGRDAVIDRVLRPASDLYEPNSMKVEAVVECTGENFGLLEWKIEGRSAAGLDYTNFYLFILRTRDGKVYSVHEYSDTQQTAEILWGARAFRDAESTTYA